MNSSSQKKAIEWIESSVGKRFDTDGQFGAQCMDYANAYATYLDHPLAFSDAAEAWSREQDPFWKKIPYTHNTKSQAGDIVIWGATPTNSFGHVAVVLEANHKSFVSVDQNWINSNLETGSPAAKITHTYKGVIGILRPRFQLKSSGIKFSDEERIKATADITANIHNWPYCLEKFNEREQNIMIEVFNQRLEEILLQ